MILIYAFGLVLLFLAHGFFSNLSSPLKLIPQTAAAIGMGYVLLYVISLRRFKFVAEFIDWTRVSAVAEPHAAPNASAAASIDDRTEPGGSPQVNERQL